MNTYSHAAFNTPAALKKSRLLPFITSVNSRLCTCSNCSFVNLASHNYCTNCGYPLAPNKDRLTLYHYRLKQRKELLKASERIVQQARNTLYIMAIVCMVSFTYFYTAVRRGTLTAIILLILAILFTGLGKWSNTRPFTSLLISFLILITFIAIYAWAAFVKLLTTSSGLYTLMAQAICFIFLMRGLQAAFRADVMEEEFKI